MTAFHTFIFDLGGVVNDHDNAMLINRLLSKCDSRASVNKLMQRFCEDVYATGERSIIDFYRKLKLDFGYSGDWQTFSEDWTCHLSMREGMLGFLRELRQSARIILLSNTNLLHWNKLLELSQFELASYEAFLSFDMGLVKPSKAIFKKLLMEAEVLPVGALFIDDRQENIDQAILCGLDAFLYLDQQSFKEFLAR